MPSSPASDDTRGSLTTPSTPSSATSSGVGDVDLEEEALRLSLDHVVSHLFICVSLGGSTASVLHVCTCLA